MRTPNVEVVIASPDILDAAATTSIENFSRQKGSRVRKWISEIAYGCATCAPAGIAAHLVSCIALPLLATSALSNVLYVDSTNLADGILHLLPNKGFTRAYAAPTLSANISDTALRTGITALFNATAYSLFYAKRLKHKTSSIRTLNASFFAAGLMLSASFNLGSFIQSKEAYNQWHATTSVADRQNLQQSVERPYIQNEYLSWRAFQGFSCLSARQPNQSLLSYASASAYDISRTMWVGASAPFNGRLTKALTP